MVGFVAVVASFAMLLAACGSDGNEGSSGGSPTSTAGSADLVASLGPDNPATGSPVKVGFVTAEGGASISLPETREAAEAAVAYANEHLGGLAGHKIELVSCKDKSDGASATACANQFVQEGVVGLTIGTLASFDPYFATLEPAGVPIVLQSPNGSMAFVSPVSYGATGGFIAGVGALATYAKENGLEKLVFLGIDVPTFTAAFDSMVVPIFERAGVKAESVLIPPGTPDASPQVSAALALQPDMMVVVADTALCKSVLPAIETLDTQDTPLAFSDTCADPTVVEAVGSEILEGAVVYNTAVSLGDDPEGTLYRSIMETYAPDTNVQGKAGTAYVSVLALIRAINHVGLTGEVTAKTVNEALKTAVDVPLPGSPDGTTFTCDRTALTKLPAACTSKIMIGKIRSGELTDFQTYDGSQYIN